ncbi:hypothetical protein GGD81_001994 [Rhodobium orientis]|uniref:DUF3445 domain-containing protein n=1 Tax=Rhodobium orientis TaxID=34017 RepID=A0A327K1R1_9HYPH|nr:DUF3445 domain-containing protein [Rhodobium orientis]MBB4302956.1 hypothetical protein [Rhodobium orientis]MBK5949517.1 hypothetical protein [Rhodobium orientis]RAI29308.1 hypothetical protein CH339_03210 [Rhodobium orientis]
MRAFLHKPYLTTKPFSIGLKPIGPEAIVETDDRVARDLAEKEALFAADEAAVFRAEQGTGAAQAEILKVVLASATDQRPDLYELDREGVTVAPAARRYRFSDFSDAPLKLAALLVQEDLCLMRKGDDGWRLAAAAVCFPSSWQLEEKFAKPMGAIHDPVPGFAGRMLTVVERIFDNLAPGSAVERHNWSLYTDTRLRHAEPHEEDMAALTPAELAERLAVRVERQTLMRLPETSDILFTIRIHVDPVETIRAHPDREKIALALAGQLAAMTPDQLRYKGLTRAAPAIGALLSDIAGVPQPA